MLKTDPPLDLPVFAFKFVCDRGITHEVVRHRVFSFTQESTRYVNYKNKGMVLIFPKNSTIHTMPSNANLRPTTCSALNG